MQSKFDNYTKIRQKKNKICEIEFLVEMLRQFRASKLRN